MRPKMQPYNAKITIGGKYLPFYGWSTVAMVNPGNDEDTVPLYLGTLGFVENFIKNDPVLASYFSTLPTNSYHVTVCNIWSNGQPLLKHQEKFLLEHYPQEQAWGYYRQSQQIGFFNPDFCINGLLHEMARVIQPGCTELIIKEVYVSGATLGISFSPNSHTTKLDRCREESIRVAELGDEARIPYHLTLAYNYRDVDISAVTPKLRELNDRLWGRAVRLWVPMVSYFSDMTKFTPYTLSLRNRSNRVPAPPY